MGVLYPTKFEKNLRVFTHVSMLAPLISAKYYIKSHLSFKTSFLPEDYLLTHR